MQQNLLDCLLTVDSSNLEKIKNIDRHRANLHNKHPVLLIYRNQHSLITYWNKQYSRFMLSYLSNCLKQKFNLGYWSHNRVILSWKFLLDFFLNLLVNIDIFPLRTNNLIIINIKKLYSVLKWQHFSSVKTVPPKQVLFNLKPQ